MLGFSFLPFSNPSVKVDMSFSLRNMVTQEGFANAKHPSIRSASRAVPVHGPSQASKREVRAGQRHPINIMPGLLWRLFPCWVHQEEDPMDNLRDEGVDNNKVTTVPAIRQHTAPTASIPTAQQADTDHTSQAQPFITIKPSSEQERGETIASGPRPHCSKTATPVVSDPDEITPVQPSQQNGSAHTGSMQANVATLLEDRRKMFEKLRTKAAEMSMESDGEAKAGQPNPGVN
ncbi:hypothetical protein LTR37_008538 [Vermiconidia calcicola]|uniref:Uncharacterized protein n=1 Tax=Vermiconidia calcicola TaxID=1690605 RepID=A0ACC3NBZ1_9PEZI|nr:hypothetical protein LTR37_008538 [Vermiconidia calcicola]